MATEEERRRQEEERRRREDEKRRQLYEERAGREGNNTIGTQANKRGYQQYLDEQRRNQEHQRRMKEALGTEASRSKSHGNQGGSCWIVTAYYGNPDHKQVILLREYRNELIHQSPMGYSVGLLNSLYHRIGTSGVGEFWKNQIANDAWIARNLSKFLISIVSYLAQKRKFLKK